MINLDDLDPSARKTVLKLFLGSCKAQIAAWKAVEGIDRMNSGRMSLAARKRLKAQELFAEIGATTATKEVVEVVTRKLNEWLQSHSPDAKPATMRVVRKYLTGN